MRGRLLKGRDSERLLIFFAGLGLDENPFKPLAAQSPFDVFVLYDYRDLSLPPWPAGYRGYFVLGWSLGGLVALKFRHALPGPLLVLGTTGLFCHPELGIPPKVYDLTLSGFRRYGERSLLKFYENMFAGEEGLEVFLENRPRRDLAGVVEELERARDLRASRPEEGVEVVVTGKDRIIPPRAQRRFWRGYPTRELPWGHFPFYREGVWGRTLLPGFAGG